MVPGYFSEAEVAFFMVVWWDTSVFSQKQDIERHTEMSKTSTVLALRFGPTRVSCLASPVCNNQDCWRSGKAWLENPCFIGLFSSFSHLTASCVGRKGF